MYPQTNPEKDGSIERTKEDQHERKRMWKPEEDMILKRYVELHGEGNWSSVSRKLGLRRGGKSCRLRWKNYLRPDIVHGAMSNDEQDLIIRMHKLVGNRWSLIAGRLPGRTDNEVKNYWNTYLSKKVSITNQGAKRKSTTSDKELDDQSHKKRTKTVGSEQTKHGHHDHEKSTQEVSPNTMVGVGVRGEISSINPSEEFLTKGDQLLVGPGSDAASPSCGIMGMHFGGGDDEGDPFIIFEQQLEEQFGADLFDFSSCVLFDAFGAPFLI